MTSESVEYDFLDLTLGQFLERKAKLNGSKPFLDNLHDGQRLTYADLHLRSQQMALGLRGHGISRGSHVAVLSENRPEQIIIYFALAMLGAVCVPVNTAAKESFLEYTLLQSDSTALVLEPEFLRVVGDVIHALPELKTIFLLRSVEPEGWHGEIPASLNSCHVIWLDSPVETQLEVTEEASPPDLVQILYTSGTTGRSKGNMFTHTAMLNWARQVAEGHELTDEDVYLVVFPLFHAGAWLSCVLSAMWTNGSVALGRRFSASRFFDQARRSGATTAFMVSVASFLSAQPPSSVDRDHRLKRLVTAPPPPDPHAFETRFGLRLVAGFGLSDYGASHSRGTSAPPSRIDSCGTLNPGWEVKCADELGRAVPIGTPGEILLRCNIPGGAASGYYKMPEATLESRRDLWFHTGDMGYVDEEGYLYFVDRKKDAIRRRGENISSLELEQVLNQHPRVASAAFFPVRAEATEDEVAVAVIRRAHEQLSEADIVTYCERFMPKYAVPRYVRFVDAFPHTASGKIQKAVLRAETESMLVHVWDRTDP